MSWRTPPAPIPASQIAHEYTADVVVVGTGNAGAPAVRAAAEAGAGVAALEKQPRDKFIALGQDVGHINSKFLESFGVPRVDPIEFFNDWMLRSGNRADPRLVMQFATKCGDAFDWYINIIKPEERAQMFVRYWPPSAAFDGKLSGYKFWHGTAVMPGWFEKGKYRLTDTVLENLDYACEKFGARVDFETTAEQIVMEGGRPAAIIARNAAGEYVRYNAKKSVVLSTGGFSGDQEMCEELLPDLLDVMDYTRGRDGNLILRDGKPFKKFITFGGRDGTGIKLGVWAGGMLEARPISTMGGNYVSHMFGLTATFGWLWLDSYGKRYSNEAFGDPVMAGYPGAQLKHDVFFSVFGSNVLEYAQYAPPAHTGFWPTDGESVKRLEDMIRRTVEAGDEGVYLRASPMTPNKSSTMYAGDTPEQLADRLKLGGARRENFIASIHRYNELCRKGRDEDFGKDAKLMIELKPPFIGLACAPSMLGNIMDTTGGLLVDERQNVLDENRDPIPGLYATGNCSGRRFGIQYSTPISGVSIGIAVTLGREAGMRAAE